MKSKHRVWKFREETVLVEYVFYAGSDAFQKPPTLHNIRLVVDRTVCNLERLMSSAMFYGNSIESETLKFFGIKFSYPERKE